MFGVLGMIVHRLVLAVALLAVALPAAPAVAAPTPAPPDFLGSNIQALVRMGFVPPTGWGHYLGGAAGDGLIVTRFDAPWMWAEPNRPGADGVHRYDWRRLDQIAAALAGRGLRWLPVVDLPPAWAHSADSDLPDAQFGAFAAFAAAFAARYGSSGSFWDAHPELPRIPVTHAEVWTEANSSHFWAADPDASHYLALFQQVRWAMKAADPAMQIIVSLGWQDFQAFTNKLYDAGLAGQSDGVGFHPYAPTARGVVVLTRRLRDILVARGEPDLPIYMTEIGWPKNQTGWTANKRAFDGPVTDQARAATASLAADALAASDCNVKDYVFYSLVEEERDPLNIEDWLGLFNADGTPTATVQALAASAQRWAGPWGQRVRAGRTPLLQLCHGESPDRVVAASPVKPGSRMPLQLTVPVPVRDRCFTIQTRYYGNPLEDVSVFVRTVRGKQAGVVTQADGLARFCLSKESRRSAFLVWARSGALAASPVVSCRGKRCYPLSCTRARLDVKRVRVRGRRLTLRVAVKCGRRVLFGEPVKVDGVDHRGHASRLKAFFTRDRTQVVAVTLPKRGKVRRVRVRFGGDGALALIARATQLLSHPRD